MGKRIFPRHQQVSQITVNLTKKASINMFFTGRIGRIYLYKYDIYADSIERLDVIDTAAILDTKWYTIGNRCFLVAASALAEIQLFELRNDRLLLIQTISLNTNNAENVLTLSIDVRATLCSTKRQNLVASDSRGMIYLFTIGPSELVLERSWQAHSFEAWTCAFDKWNQHIIYTGGDDMFFNIYDTRASEVQVTTKNRIHTAGVTSFLCFSENVLLTGSYDEKLRIFDKRSFKNPVAELDLGGGIWRIKSSKFNRNQLLCACMYKNFSVCKINEELNGVELVAEYNEHESICYGCDWAPNQLCNQSQVMITCSFYDKRLCISTVFDSKRE